MFFLSTHDDLTCTPVSDLPTVSTVLLAGGRLGTKVVAVRACNKTDGTTATLTLSWTDVSQAATAVLVWKYELAPGESQLFESQAGFVLELEEGDTLQALASAGSTIDLTVTSHELQRT